MPAASGYYDGTLTLNRRGIVFDKQRGPRLLKQLSGFSYADDNDNEFISSCSSKLLD